MPKKKPYLSIIIPAHNEAQRLPHTLLALDKHLEDEAPYTYEIIVVNDGSSDETGSILRSLTDLLPHLEIIDLTKRQGKGAAVQKGMLASSGAYRLFTDADNAVPIEQFTNEFFDILRDENKDVLVSKWIEDDAAIAEKGAVAKFTDTVGRSIIQLFALPELSSPHVGFKCFSERAALRIFPLQKLKGWGFDAEILLLAERFGYVPHEVPVLCRNHTFSYVGPWDPLRIAIDALRTRSLLRRNGYELDKTWDLRL